MHTIYHTRAVILKSSPAREADKMFWLFTEELGLVVAIATGVRKGESKLKGQLTDYAFVSVDLVRGKDIWRLISASEEFNPLIGIVHSQLARAYVRTLGTLERFLVDEGVHPELWDHIQECAHALQDTAIDARVYDTLAIWRILVHLGYIAVDADQERLFTESFAHAMGSIDEEKMRHMIKVVNETIVHTHL